VSDLHFEAPLWVHAFWGLLALGVGLVLLERRGGRALDRLVTPWLAARLVERPAPWRRHARVALLLLCLAATIVALMRPQWGLRYVQASRVGAELMICLDVSRSMLAEDVAPNRLERAKAELVDLLQFLEGDEVGLIAFAGRATVLSPLTPDFSFLRLVLEGAGPGSVARGGTRLEEPLRKALAGFAASGSAARAILLITDGEDLDSFPLEAAREARAAGVRVIAIGFGSEAGSQIYVTDPRSGARTLLRDAQGEPVVSRLGGELLRDIVREAGGAYVPAGTGVLDLEAIYREHIADLLRGELSGRGRPLRDEGYPWALLVAWLGLLGAVAMSSRADPARAAPGGAVRALVVLLASALLLAPLRGWTQEGVGDPSAPDVTEPAPEASARAADGTEAEASAPAVDSLSPRERYNESLALLEKGDLESAERALRAARSAGAEDGELRFRASYNLGIAAALRAESVHEKDPQAALGHLYESADRLREAVRQQPDDADSRHNLEVVLKRALVLADEIARRGAADLPARLDALLARERAVAERAAGLIDDDPSPDEDLLRRRGEHRSVSGDQRVLLADSDALAREIAAERDGVAKRAGEPDSEDAGQRAVLLDRVLEHLYSARGHMGAARSQLRLLQSERAYRRAAAAIDDLERARDVLRDPAQVLDALVRDAISIGTQASALADPASAPAWLSGALLEQGEESLAARTAELGARLASAGSEDDDGNAEAARLVGDGETAFRTTLVELQQQRFGAALEGQRRGIESLLAAREQLLSLRPLIELVYRDERMIQGSLEPQPRAGTTVLPLPAARELQQRNVARGARLETLLAREKARAEAPPPPPAEGQERAGPDTAQLETVRKRIALAEPLLQRARARMDGANDLLAKAQKPQALEAAKRAAQELAQLRRLFFSTAELVRDAAERQLELGDDTRDLATVALPEERRARAQPLASTQSELADQTGDIADTLEQQSRQSVGAVDQEPQAGQASDRLRMAAEHVLSAQTAMNGAKSSLAKEPVALDDARKSQQTAVEKLAAALELLTPPGEPPPNEPQKNDDPGDGENQDQNDPGGSGQGSPSDAEDARDPSQMLQAVRDRDAQRRRAQAQRGAGSEAVERDW
jgi:Ca-activated chloride channel homolog